MPHRLEFHYKSKIKNKNQNAILKKKKKTMKNRSDIYIRSISFF